MEIVYQYRPREGEHIAGVPARDLTADDVAVIAPQFLRDAVGSGLYVPAKQHAVTKSPAVATKEVSDDA
jgi:hypothetical protein